VRDRLRGAARGDDAKAVVMQALCDRERARLVGVGDGDEDGPERGSGSPAAA